MPTTTIKGGDYLRAVFVTLGSLPHVMSQQYTCGTSNRFQCQHLISESLHFVCQLLRAVTIEDSGYYSPSQATFNQQDGYSLSWDVPNEIAENQLFFCCTYM